MGFGIIFAFFFPAATTNSRHVLMLSHFYSILRDFGILLCWFTRAKTTHTASKCSRCMRFIYVTFIPSGYNKFKFASFFFLLLQAHNVSCTFYHAPKKYIQLRWRCPMWKIEFVVENCWFPLFFFPFIFWNTEKKANSRCSICIFGSTVSGNSNDNSKKQESKLKKKTTIIALNDSLIVLPFRETRLRRALM